MNNDWTYGGEVFTTDKIDDNYGFVYLITNIIDGRKYIGKKLFWSAKTRQVKKKKKKYKAESDWQKYYGSNIELLADVEKHGKENFRRQILVLCKSKGECSYFEAKFQFTFDALLKNDYYNKWIMCRINAAHLKNLHIDSSKQTE